MKKEDFLKLGANLSAQYKAKAKTSASAGVGLIRTIVGLTESEQGYLHLEDFKVLDNQITLGNFLKMTQDEFDALNRELQDTRSALALVNQNLLIENKNLKAELGNLRKDLDELIRINLE